MTIDLVFRDYTHAKRPALSRAVALRVIEVTLPYLGLDKGKTVELALIVSGTERMRKLNKKYRKVDKATDVLAFPLLQSSPKGYTSISLGDVFLCPVMVRAKASQTGLSERDQMAWTLVHGLLHLAGHDHEKSAEAAKKMAVLEHLILKKLNA